MVNTGKPQILERQTAQLFNCLFDIDLAVFDLLK
jgi:hypothetical protein